MVIPSLNLKTLEWEQFEPKTYCLHPPSTPYVKVDHVIGFQYICPDSKVHGANMGSICGRQDPGEHHVGPMNIAIWVYSEVCSNKMIRTKKLNCMFQLM